MKLGNIEIGTKKGYHSHPVDVDNNTSAGFGFVQPLFSKFLEEGEALKMNFTQEVLLSPTVCPCYARMSVHNQARFVKMCEIFPGFDALLSHLPINGKDSNYIPASVPWLRQRFLLKYIFKDSYVTCYKLTKVDGTQEWSYQPQDDIVEGKTWPQNGVSYCALTSNGLIFNEPLSSSTPYPFISNIKDSSSPNFVTFDGADFVLTETLPNPIHPQFSWAIAVKMTAKARNLYKIFKGLGYSLSIEDNDMLSFLPLLAYYKAWFDSYAPQRYVNWHLTNAYKLVNLFYQTGSSSLESLYSNPNLATLFDDFFNDLSSCFYTYPSDYISAHTITPVNLVDSTAFSMDFPGQGTEFSGTDTNNLNNNIGEVPNVGPFSSDVMNNYTLKALKFMAKFVQKNSIIGGRVSQYIRNHYNMNVSDDMFADSTNLGDFLTECSIDKVLSTADTSQTVDGQQFGEKIGSYAGFGRGMNKYDISFTAPSTGFYIILTSVVPYASYCQGNGNDLYMLDRYTFPSEDFDALGLELTPRHSLIDSSIGTGSDERNKTSFGWIPRLSKYKVFKNILNGCMSFRSTQNSYLPYCFDKIARSHDVVVNSANNTLHIDNYPVPNASVEWRYCNKYPWLSSWNRIFYNNGENYQSSQPFDDNFIIQTRLNGNFRSKLIPLSQSFDIVDEEDDNTKDKISID